MSSLPSVSILLSSSNHSAFLDSALRSVLEQDEIKVECVVVDEESYDGSKEILGKFSSRLAGVITASRSNLVQSLNSGFAQTTGDIMLWLRADEMLCPWACRTVATLFRECSSLEWVTTNIPVVWSRSRICVSNLFSDGFSKTSFYTGRNLRGSPNYHHPIERAATFWSRSLWKRSGGYVESVINEAGDFELWSRFWNFASLGCISIPFGGKQISVKVIPTPEEDKYWAAAKIVMSRSRTKLPSRLELSLRQLLAHRIPRIAPHLSSRALTVWLNPEDDRCTLSWRYIV